MRSVHFYFYLHIKQCKRHAEHVTINHITSMTDVFADQLNHDSSLAFEMLVLCVRLEANRP